MELYAFKTSLKIHQCLKFETNLLFGHAFHYPFSPFLPGPCNPPHQPWCTWLLLSFCSKPQKSSVLLTAAKTLDAKSKLWSMICGFGIPRLKCSKDWEGWRWYRNKSVFCLVSWEEHDLFCLGRNVAAFCKHLYACVYHCVDVFPCAYINTYVCTHVPVERCKHSASIRNYL